MVAGKVLQVIRLVKKERKQAMDHALFSPIGCSINLNQGFPALMHPNRLYPDLVQHRKIFSSSFLNISKVKVSEYLIGFKISILEKVARGHIRSNMGGNCIIYEEFWRQPNEVEFEQVNLYRTCDKYLATPYNFYSTMITNATSMTICDSDLCNQKGSAVTATITSALFIAIYFVI